MNDDSNRSQLNSLKVELERVEMDLRFLRVKAAELESKITAQERATTQNEILERLTTHPLTPPPLPQTPIQITPIASEPILAEKISEPPAPPIIPEPVFQTTESPAGELPPIVSQPVSYTPPPPPAPPIVAAEPESFEMRLGTYWFVRIGIVMVLTAMVFLGNYAYQHYIGLLGPLGKLILLYLVSAGLLAAGKILPRKQERLKNYSQVLFAGGLAAVYFTTYAAHHFANLRIITNPLLDGVLLLGWTSYIVWLADRKKSEVLAVFAIGLAYYTALITNVGNFTLISNLLLAAAAVFFLIRNRWITLTFLSIAASYGSYFYWRYYAASPDIDEFAGRFSICGYWIIFTSAVFFTRHADFSGSRRAGFLSFNNAASFMLLTYSFLHQHSGKFWQLSLAAGALLLALSYLAFKFIPEDELPRRAYLAQGLLLTTLGIITKLSGPTLALVLAVESALLLIFSTQWKSRFVRAASIVVGALSALWLLGTIHATDAHAWAEAAGMFALLLFNAFWSGKYDDETDEPFFFRPLPTYFAAVSLITWCGASFSVGQPLQIAPILAVTAVALTAFHYILRVSEVTIVSQAVLAVAQAHAFFLLTDKQLGPVWSPVIVIILSLAMSLWWTHQKLLTIEKGSKQLIEIFFAFGAAVLTQLYLPQGIHGEGVITASWILTAVSTALGIFARSWPIAAGGQLFLIAAWYERVTAMFVHGNGDISHHSVEIIGTLLILSAIAHVFSKRHQAASPLRVVTHLYQWAAAFLTLAWVTVHVGEPFQFVVLSVLFASCVIAALAGIVSAFPPSVMLATASLFIWINGPRSDMTDIQNLLAILIIAASQFLARRKSDKLQLPEPAHQSWIAISALAMWIFTSRWVIVHSSGAHFYLTASWAILAFILFGLGFALRERTYRWAALTVLACALARVVMLDVWKLETSYRIFSFFALGIVLLVLGYFYTRFQEKITKWL